MLPSVSDKAKLFPENFTKNSNLDNSGISLPAFFSRTNLELHDIHVTHKLIKKVIANLDTSKASGPDCIPGVVLKNYEAKPSYILVTLFNMYLKESCFPDCWKVSSMVLLFKNVRESSTAKNYYLVSLLHVVNKIFKNLQIISLLIILRNSLLYFLFCFRSSGSTTDFLTVCIFQ